MAASIYDVAKAAGVALGTVSRVINGATNVSPAIRVKVEAAMLQLDYQPSTVARSLASGSSQSVALIVPDLANPFFADVAAGIEEITDPRGFVVIVCSASSEEARERRALKMLSARQVDGLLMVGSNLTPQALAELTNGVPVVQVDRELKAPGAVVVKLDHRLGGTTATRHLLDLGHRRIAFLHGAVDNDPTRARFWGYEDALREAGIEFDPGLVASGELSIEGGMVATGELLARDGDFTAVFASNDLMAMGAMTQLRAAGRLIPDDVSVIGFDDIHLARCTSPGLTTIRQPAGEMGRRAAAILLQQIDGEPFDTRVILDPQLVIRESTSHAK